jgi:probable phosphoglycerate mutase
MNIVDMKIYFIRHGFAHHNLGARLYGDAAYNLPQYKDARLTNEGIEHAKEVGKSLSGVHFNRIYSSPSTRCIETLNHFISNNQSFNNNNKIIVLDDRLMEPQGVHICNNRKERIEIEKFLSEYDNKTYDLKNVSLNYNPKYESKNQTINKIVSFIDDLKKTCNDETILVVSHYGWLNTFFEIATGKGHAFFNCEVKIVEMKND